MIPLKDNVPLTRSPLVAALLVVAAAVAAIVLREGEVLLVAVDLLFLWIFARTLESTAGRVRLVLAAAAGAAAAVGIHAALDPDAAHDVIATSGAVAGVLGAHVALHPRSRVISLVLVPLFFTVVEVPSLLLMAAWLAIQLLAGGIHADGLAGGADALVACVGALALGALLTRASVRPLSHAPTVL